MIEQVGPVAVDFEEAYGIGGCIDPTALNHNSDATFNDGSCSSYENYGCTNPNASNYDATKEYDDGSCENYDLPLETPASFEAEQIYGIGGCTDPPRRIIVKRQNTTMARVITRIMVAPIRWPRTMMKQQNLMMEVALILVNPSQPQLLTT